MDQTAAPYSQHTGRDQGVPPGGGSPRLEPPGDGHLDTATLSLHLDGALPPEGHDTVSAHLAACAACRRHRAELAATVALLRGLPEPHLRRSFTLGPEHARAAGPPTRRWLARFLPALPALRTATLVVALALAAVTIGEFRSDGDAEQDIASGPSSEAGVPPGAGDPTDAIATVAPAGRQDGGAPAESGAPAGSDGESAPNAESASGSGSAPESSRAQATATEAARYPADEAQADEAQADTVGEGAAPAAPPVPAAPAPSPQASTIPGPDPAAPAAAAAASPGAGTPSGGRPASPIPGRTPAAEEDGGSDAQGGVSGWRVAQVVLATLLVWLLAGVTALSQVRRDRRRG